MRVSEWERKRERRGSKWERERRGSEWEREEREWNLREESEIERVE